jgi:hypothetical protein
VRRSSARSLRSLGRRRVSRPKQGP